MSDIFNLSALCRCCHADGTFKPLQSSVIKNGVENYVKMLLETLGVIIQPPRQNESYAICDDCIAQLRSATQFKEKVLKCEAKFEEYCKNELSNFDVKIEPEYLDDNIFDDDNDKYQTETESVKEQPDKKPSKRVKVKKEEYETIVEISVDVQPKLEVKPDKEKTKPTVKGKPRKKKDLVLKVKTETGELYSCKDCGASYENIEDLTGHIAEHNNGFKCSHCTETLPSGLAFKIHNQKEHDDRRPFACQYCGRKVATTSSLKEHINTVHFKHKYFQCDECKKTFHSKAIMRIHIQKHAGTFRKLICEQCGVRCNDKTNLRLHIMTVHERVKLFPCPECGKAFSAAKHLKVHLRLHTGERPFECDVCMHAFVSKEGMKAHKKLHFANGYKCRMCAMTFQTRGQYASHYRTHVISKPYKCHLCEKEFAGKYSLNRHVFEHSGERPFICQICNKDFKQKPQLVRHNKRFHNPDKPEVIKEKCNICNRTVPFLQRHLESHTNKPYSCHLCEKRYPLQNALTRHLQRHAGIKPHKCDLCDKGFIQLKSLINHKLKVHKQPLKTEQEDHYDSLVTIYTLKKLKTNK